MAFFAKGDLKIDVELLGTHSHTAVKKGSQVVLQRLKVSDWQMSRKLTTTLLSVIDMNAAHLPKIEVSTAPDSPVRKAMKCTLPAEVTVEFLHKVRRQALDKTHSILPQQEVDDTMKLFVVQGKIVPFSENIFEQNAPFYTTPTGTHDFKLFVRIQDETGTFGAVMFKAARSLLKSDAESILGLWEQCTSPDGKAAFLAKLNGCADTPMRFVCTAKLWSPDNQEDEKFEVVVQQVMSLEDDL